MSQVDELLLHFKGCLSREDEGGMIDVPAWYVKGAIAALETAKPAPEPAPSPGAVQGSGVEAVRDLVMACYDEMHGPQCNEDPDDEHVASCLDETGKAVPAGRITFGMIRRAVAGLASLSPAPTSGSEAGGEAFMIAAKLRVSALHRDIPVWISGIMIEAARALAKSAPEPAGDVREACARMADERADICNMLANDNVDRQVNTTRRDAFRELATAMRALSAPASGPGSGVRVRPLEWSEQRDPSAHIAETGIGRYFAQNMGGGEWLWYLEGRAGGWRVVSLNAAKNAAQADYEQRIRSALDASPPPAQGETR